MNQRTYPFKNNMSNNKRKEQRERKFYPKGFDIDLAEVLSEFHMGDAEIKRLGSDKSIASAFVGKTAFYRRSQLASMFAKAPTRAAADEYDDIEDAELLAQRNPDDPNTVWVEVDESTVYIPAVIDIADIAELEIIEDDEGMDTIPVDESEE